ncbi:hypothetical protein BU15DRAFT_87083 [Melanogaster broomeanus]|nr:hypothetical protein BU15DRAFT_87083 [Melanogaster broomeanus]
MANRPPPSPAAPNTSETTPQQPHSHAPTSSPSKPDSDTGPTAEPSPAYYTMSYPPGTWQNAWQLSGYPYATTSPTSPNQPLPASARRRSRRAAPPPPKPRTPTPEPVYRHWDEVIRAFLQKVGLAQALRGFEADMVVLNAEWERKSVPGAIGDLVRDLMTLGKFKEGEEPKERHLEERKLDYVHLSTGAAPQPQSTVTKSISQFLAQNRAKNDASNRAEFLESLAQKRRRLNIDPESTDPIPSCARTDAKHLDRDSQMKYDIAKNEDGPLKRTMKGAAGKDSQGKEKLRTPAAMDERLKNIEAHLAVRYGMSRPFSRDTSFPAPPRTLRARLQFLENHLIQLEKEYPPWAALHFNQPNRGVEMHPSTSSAASTRASPSLGATDEPGAAQTKGKNKSKSSLHRAVMEKLEVQKAMNDLAGAKRGG